MESVLVNRTTRLLLGLSLWTSLGCHTLTTKIRLEAKLPNSNSALNRLRAHDSRLRNCCDLKSKKITLEFVQARIPFQIWLQCFLSFLFIASREAKSGQSSKTFSRLKKIIQKKILAIQGLMLSRNFNINLCLYVFNDSDWLI